jgi:hypothetical protein
MSPKLWVVVIIGALVVSCTTPNPAFKSTDKDTAKPGDGPARQKDATVSSGDGSACTPQCAERECGADSCGGLCGICPPGKTCNWQGKCETSCKPQCEDRQCGPDDCGGTCGYCSPPLSCDEGSGRCIPSCAPNCVGKQCGPDGCGGSCGKCSEGKICDKSGQCVGGGLCGYIDGIGCCDGNILKYCSNNGALKVEDCSKSPKCGWDFQHKYYNCGTTGIADPSAKYPKSCP